MYVFKSDVTITNADTDEDIAKIDINSSMDLGTATAVHFGSLVRTEIGWHFKNESIGFPGGLTNFFKKYNVSIIGG